jgi:hypothetical protein
MRLDDDVQSRTSHRSKRSHTSRLTSRPPLERNYTDNPRSSRHRFEDDLAGASEGGRELTRRNSEQIAPVQRSQSLPYVDMDLAYGDVPPPLPETRYDDGEIKEKASKITMLLDEANCLQYSATTMIENLQKNPEALAAVSLTLAEISALIGKMGPGVLPILKGSFPAVAALLLSPQFMIAGGVAVGVTIVALGGYKIIKKIQNHHRCSRADPSRCLQTPRACRPEAWSKNLMSLMNSRHVSSRASTSGAAALPTSKPPPAAAV